MAKAVRDRVLIVDDSAIDRAMVADILNDCLDLEIIEAAGGPEALATIRSGPVGLVLTDMKMPGMDGLALVAAINRDFPDVPVIVMTGQGSQSAAFEALRSGASGYVGKDWFDASLAPLVERTVALARTERRKRKFLANLEKVSLRFVMSNDTAEVQTLIAYLKEHMERLRLGDARQLNRVAVALEEAMLNGIHHGNLELSSDLRQDGSDAYERLAEQRVGEPPYCDRRLRVSVEMDRDRATFIVADEGPGFDVATLPDPTDPENLLKASGRGMLLIRTFMDEATHNASGNELTMVFIRKAA